MTPQEKREALEAFETALNDGNFAPNVEEGQVTSLRVSTQDEEREATPEEVEALGFEDGCIEAHPEGSDRGGYVPFVYHKSGAGAYFYEPDNTWYSAWFRS